MLDLLSSGLATAQHFDAWLLGSDIGYFTRLYGYFYAISILASCWVFHVARRLKPGLWRAVACLPVSAFQLSVTPLLVDRNRTPILIVPVMGIFSLAAFKVAAFAFGRGPLALRGCPWLGELKKFGAILSFPVVPKAAFKLSKGTSVDSLSSSAPTTPATFLYSYCCKAAGAAAAASLAVWPALPVLLNHWFYALCLSLSLGAIWDFWCLVASLWFGVEVAPSFDKPWLSTSFADYWSRRWNLTTTYMLRVLIYEPVMEGRLVPADSEEVSADSVDITSQPDSSKQSAALAPAGPEDNTVSDVVSVADQVHKSLTHRSSIQVNATARPLDGADQMPDDDRTKKTENLASTVKDSIAGSGTSSSVAAKTGRHRLLRRLAALQATFAFSGAWHALIFYYATGLVTYHWFTFFSIQAPIMAVEAILIKWAKSQNMMLKRPIAIFLTNFLLIVVANPLFFGPCDWSGMCTAMLDNVKGSIAV